MAFINLEIRISSEETEAGKYKVVATSPHDNDTTMCVIDFDNDGPVTKAMAHEQITHTFYALQRLGNHMRNLMTVGIDTKCVWEPVEEGEDK